MNEAQTEFELIEPKLKDSGWGIITGSKIYKQFKINLGRIQSGNYRLAPLKADYVLEYNSRKLAVIEAKSDELQATEGVMQAKNYAKKLNIGIAFSTNGKQIYQICMETGKENFVDRFPTPQELWEKIEIKKNLWANKFNEISYDGKYQNRFYQEIAVNKVLDVIANGKTRILLTLATGTGKTNIASQISWKLCQAKWTLQKDEARKTRILFLTDRNFLANQAFNEFSVFQEDSKIRITTNEIRKKGKIPTNGNIFFTIFQTFMSGPNNSPYFGEYPKDFFDFIIIDECHRGGANDESSWRAIMEYFSPAVQLGLTATPKRTINADTYNYFGEPVYVYSLKEGINDGFLTPFKVKQIDTTIDEYLFTSDDTVLEGEIEEGKRYTEAEMNRIIEIKEREEYRVKIFMSLINQSEKTLVFCATQLHALAIRDIINQYATSKNPNFCHRVTADDGKLGEQHLRDFQDNEKSIPTIL